MTPPAVMTAHTAHAPEAEEKKSFVRKYVFSIDHKVIGKQFLFSSLLFFVVGGLLALLMRTQLAWPWEEIPVVGGLVYGNSGNILAPEAYPALVTMHGTIMIFFFIIPILSGAFGNFLIPLLIGEGYGLPPAQPALLLGDGAGVPGDDRRVLRRGRDGG